MAYSSFIVPNSERSTIYTVVFAMLFKPRPVALSTDSRFVRALDV